jgi:O-antigen ligase
VTVLGLTILLTWAPLDLAVIALGGMALTLLLLIRPWLIWPLLGFALPVSSSIGVGPGSLTDLIFVGAVGLWLINGAARRSLCLQPMRLLPPLALYGVVLYLALLQATDLREALPELLKWVQFALVLLIVPAMVPRRQAGWLVGGLLLGGAAQALLGIYQFTFRIGPEWFEIMGRFMRASGSFSQPNPYGGYLGLSLPIAISLTLWSLQQLWQHRRQGLSPRMVAIVLGSGTGALLLAAGLLASWSRGGWLGALGSTGAIILLRSRRAMIGGSMLLLVALLALLIGLVQPQWIPAPLAARFQDVPAYLGMTDLLQQPVTNENFAIIERLAHWEAALRMWERAPWLGVGPGNYATIYPEVRLPRWEEALGHAHNIYLNTLAESGLWGLFAYLTFWGATLIYLWRRRTLTQPAWGKALVIGVIGTMCHLSIHNFFDNLFVQGIYLHVALGLSAVELVGQQPTISQSDPIQ